MKRLAPTPPTSLVLGIPSGFVRDSIKIALGGVTTVQVVGEAQGVDELRNLLSRQRAEVLLLGHTLTDLLPLQDTEVRAVIMLPSELAADLTGGLLKRGAAAVVTTDIHMADLVAVLQVVTADMLVLPAKAGSGKIVSDALFQHTQAANPGLSPQERELLQVLAQGFSEKEASVRLGIGRRTIQTYIERTRRKLGATNRVHAISLAVARGLVSPNRPSD